MADGPLARWVVVEAGRDVALRYCGRLFAQLGATVVRASSGDDELIGYPVREGDTLVQPVRGGGARLSLSAEGLLRVRFGTQPAEHEPGAMVRWMPERLPDRALLGSDVPESESGSPGK